MSLDHVIDIAEYRVLLLYQTNPYLQSTPWWWFLHPLSLTLQNIGRSA